MTDRAELIELIKIRAKTHDLPWELVAAVVEVESSFDPYAIRYESAYKWLVGRDEQLTATERMQQMTSWGLMQVMGGVAREYGFTGFCSRLCIPSVGIYYGMLHLEKYHRRYPNWSETIASYNAGRPVTVPTNGKFVNQAYVDNVLSAWHRYEEP